MSSVVTGALGSLAPKLLLLLRDEHKLQKGVRKQVQWLHSELESIHAFLRKVSDMPWDCLDEQVKLWAREVKEASYDMEDVLDTFLVRVDKGGSADPSWLKRAMKKTGKVFSKAKTRHDIAGAVEDIKKRLEEIAQRRQNYKVDENMSKLVTETSTVDPRLPAMYKEVEQLIGVDKSRDELISMLNPPHHLTKKVSIVGVGGLGKTTLAKAVYDKLKPQYDCGAFVSVGRDYNLVKVFKDILFQLDKHEYQNIHNTGRGVDLLISELREFLQNKRYFMVVDDVWKVDTWETIKLALVENNYGSKIITTTRNHEVAKEADEAHKLKPLCNNDSMQLFYTRIFDAEGKDLDYQEDEVSIKILKKCSGIPLAIITMASLLASKPMFEWSDVLNSIGFGSKDNKESENTMKILSLSYYDLPPHLRTCLLYLSTYPEDYLIKKDPLIWKWIAEGFINGKEGTRLFELGERYFNDLINRCLIQVVETWDYRVEGCRVHDMVLDLMRDLSFEENFVSILGDHVEGTPVPSSARRLADQNRTVELINVKATGTGIPKVRSYSAFMCCLNDPVQFLSFKLLRMIDIVECRFEEGCHLEHLGDLLHLRYLRIRCRGSVRRRGSVPRTKIKLPTQIGNLKLLQALDVSGILPASIIQLTELLRLYAHNNVPDGIGRLVSLEELVVRDWCRLPERFLKELGSLQELRVLELFMSDGMDDSMQRDFVDSLSNLKKIQHLTMSGLCFEADTAMWEAVRFVLPRALRYLQWTSINLSKIPSCINPSRLPNLSHLTLKVTSMDDRGFERLARLPALNYLCLETSSTLTASNINAGDDFFHKLRYFWINKMVQFEQPNEEDTSVSLHIGNRVNVMPFSSKKSNCSKVVPFGVMPNLEFLGFWLPLRDLKINNGECRIIGLEYLPSLREVRGSFSCHGMSAEVVDAAMDVLRNECKAHRNHPTLDMERSHWDELKDNNESTEEEEDEKQQEGAVEASQTADADVGKLGLATS